MNEHHAASPQQDRKGACDVRLLGSVSRNLGQPFVPALQPEKYPKYIKVPPKATWRMGGFPQTQCGSRSCTQKTDVLMSRGFKSGLSALSSAGGPMWIVPLPQPQGSLLPRWVPPLP